MKSLLYFIAAAVLFVPTSDIRASESLRVEKVPMPIQIDVAYIGALNKIIEHFETQMAGEIRKSGSSLATFLSNPNNYIIEIRAVTDDGHIQASMYPKTIDGVPFYGSHDYLIDIESFKILFEEPVL